MSVADIVERLVLIGHAAGGEYIRCEGRPRNGGAMRQLKKDDVLDDSNCVVRMKASRKGLRVKLNVGSGS